VIVTIREINEELKEDNNPKFIEWDAVGADGKEIKPKIYPAIQVNEQWVHFEDRWDEFKGAKDKTYDIERASIKIGQRTWMPVVKATEVKDVFEQKAAVKMQVYNRDNERTSIERQVSAKCACEIASDKDTIEQILSNAEKIAQWIARREAEAIAEVIKVAKEEEPAQGPLRTTKAPPESAEAVEFDDSPIANRGELWSRCKNYNISRAEGLKLLELDDQSQIVDLDEAWQIIFDSKFL